MHAPARAVSDDQGTFRMEGLEPGMYYIRAGGLIRHPRPDKGLKEGPGGGLRYRDTYYPGTGRLDEARPVEIGSAEGPANIRIPLTTERTYTVSGVMVDAGRSGVLKPSHVEVVKRGDGDQMW